MSQWLALLFKIIGVAGERPELDKEAMLREVSENYVNANVYDRVGASYFGNAVVLLP
jgi:hypothetical protein